MGTVKRFNEFGKDVVSDFFVARDDVVVPEDMVSLAKAYGKEKGSINAAKKDIKMREANLAIKEERLFAVLEDLGIPSFATDGYTFFQRVDRYASVDIQNTETAFNWIRDIGYAHLVELKVNAQSLTAAVKDHIEQTGEAPSKEDGINIRVVNRIGVRKK